MSPRLISRSPDLARLRDEGYEVEVVAGHLLLKNVPYVTSRREVKRGTLVSELNLAGDVTAAPGTHVVHFAGEHPCDKHGREIVQIKNASNVQELADAVGIDHTFSSKPPNGYPDYFQKMSTYATILSAPAASLDPRATPKTFVATADASDESVFKYIDTATARAGLGATTAKLTGHRVAIVGLGGTGSYILDLVAKTPVAEIHLFDGDDFLQHNAFRAPGAPALEALRSRPTKVDHFAQLYGNMHRGIVPHGHHLDASNVEMLDGMTFCFVSIDRGSAKRAIVDSLEARSVPFIDVGMGLQLVDGALLGVLRVTTSTPAMREHVHAKQRISFGDGDADDAAIYGQNVQIAELNALNANLAVIRWKKHLGFYHDQENEHFSTYTIDGHMLTSDDRP
jgi:tRNA A37 threonylcarbamoyladenosine dehydratase